MTFVKAQVGIELLAEVRSSAQDYMEFHPLPRGVGKPEPLHCIFEPEQLVDGQLFIAVVNYSDRSFYLRNSDPLGFLTTANTQPFFDAIATIEQKQILREAGNSSTLLGADNSIRGEQEYQGQPDRTRDSAPTAVGQLTSDEQQRYLEACQYGDLSDNQLVQVQNLLLEYRDCFAMEGDELGLCNRITHDIKTLTDDLVVSQPYRVPKALEPEVKKIVQERLDQNLIRKSHSEYSSPVVLVEKPDKSLRFCVNYQKLNAISKKRSFPLPNPDELLAKVG